MWIHKQFLVLLTFLFSSSAYAFYTDLNFVYLTDTLTESTTTGNVRTFYDFSIGLDVDRKGRYTLGWNISSVSATTTAATNTTFTLSEMGPKFTWHMDKEKSWNFSATYNLQVNATYNDGSSETKWRGTSIKADFGYAPKVTETIYAGVKLNYYAASFNEEVDGTTLNTISYSRGIIYPSLYIAYKSGN